MPIENAVFDPVSGFIFGVRGQWITKFSPVDGSVVAGPIRFSPNAVDRSYITALAGVLYCSTSTVPYDAIPFNNFAPGDIYAVNATTLAATTLSVTALTGQTYAIGYGPITNDGTKIGVVQYFLTNVFGNGQQFIVFSPSNVPGFVISAQGGNVLRDLSYDFDNSGYWGIDPALQIVWFVPSSNLNIVRTNAGFPANVGSGVSFNSLTKKAYMVNGTGNLQVTPVEFPPVNGFPLTTIATGRGSANPFRIASCNNLAGNPYNGKVLIPAWNDDTVLIWDPISDNAANMVVKTGFTAPTGIVHCTSTSFAVQSSSVGLKLI